MKCVMLRICAATRNKDASVDSSETGSGSTPILRFDRFIRPHIWRKKLRLILDCFNDDWSPSSEFVELYSTSGMVVSRWPLPMLNISSLSCGDFLEFKMLLVLPKTTLASAIPRLPPKLLSRFFLFLQNPPREYVARLDCIVFFSLRISALSMFLLAWSSLLVRTILIPFFRQNFAHFEGCIPAPIDRRCAIRFPAIV